MSDELEKASPGKTGETDKNDKNKRSKATVGRRRRLLSLRSLVVAAGVVTVIIAFLAIGTGIAYKTGAVDRYVKGQFTAAFDEMNVSMNSERFELQLSPLKLYVEKALFTNRKTGQKLIAVENMAFDLSVLDLLSMSTIRNVSIDRADINGIDIWIDFDKNGKSNYSGIEILPPKNNVRLQYSAAEVALRNGRIHFGDELHSIRGNARELSVFLKPDTVRPADSKEMSFLFDLTSKESNFFYDEEEVQPVDIRAGGRIHPEGAEISNLELKSPIGDSVLSGTISSWESLEYDFRIKSTIDLTRTSTVFPMGTAISGVGNFEGTVSGKGSKYKIRGNIASDSLAAENIRLKALRVTADADGEGSMYRANGKVVAELLTFEDYRIGFPSLIGTVRGSGTDFKWFGELQAASLKSPLGTIGSLIISDAVAEYEDNRLAATFGNVRARKFTNDSVNLESIQTGNIRIVSSNGSIDAIVPRATAASLKVDGAGMRGVVVDSARVKNRGGTTTVTADSARLSDFQSGDTKLGNARASEIDIVNRDGKTRISAMRIESDEVTTPSSKTSGVSASNVTVDLGQRDTRINAPEVRIARVEASSAVLSNLNIAGVRLTVRDGIIEGETADFDAGDIDLKENGRLQRVAVKKPVFVLEPSGRYRASLDMSLGGGVIGSVTLGSARASVIADNDIVELSSLSAEVMNGKIDGNAKIALVERRRSEVKADFRDLDISKLLALQGGRVVPLEGKTNGRADLSFNGMNFNTASGTLNAVIDAAAGTEDSGYIPVDGRLGVSATNGLFNIDFANLRTAKSAITADGRFDLNGDDSDLNLALDSSDAAEIERIVRVIDVSPELEQQLDSFEISPMGALAVNGRLTGNLSSPLIDGRGSLASLVVRGRDLGSVVANMANDQSRFRVSEGVLQSRDGGSVRFGVEVPWTGSNNIDLKASLNDIDLANLIVLIPRESIPERLRDVEGTTTGSLTLAGLPKNLSGEARLFTRNGSINGQSFENLTSNAVFEGQTVRLNKFDAGFGQGTLSANGFYKADTTEFDFELSAKDIPAAKLLAFAPRSDSTPEIDGDIDLTATASGRSDDTASYNINFDGTGSGISINQSRFGKIDFTGKTENKVLNATATTNLSGRKQPITARLDFADERLPFIAETNLDRSPIGPYLEIFRRSDPDAVSISGEVTGGVSVSGDLTALDPEGTRVFTWDNLSGRASLTAASFQFDETPLSATEPVLVTFSTSEVVFENAKFAGGGSNLVVSGKKAFTDSGINNLAIDGRVNLGIVRAFSRNTLKNIFLNGVADIEIRLSGVNRTSRLNGTAILENGSAATFVGANRISFERVNGRIRFTTNQVQIEQVTAFLGGGKVTASGGALL
ncbi:MAG: hypothetical protein OEM82_01140, partial [Acidobacteriota bacterium]|nr:hypothetical protein [Acidobacteriota bacterium]